jgi:hypothetical protein
MVEQMIPVVCLTKDDCVRACIASILEIDAADVPHFYDQEDTVACQLRMQEWLRERGLIIAIVPLPGSMTQDEMFQYMSDNYTFHYFMLWCNSGDGDHAVVGINDKMAHNPAWYRSPIDGPHSSGFWIVWIIVKL